MKKILSILIISILLFSLASCSSNSSSVSISKKFNEDFTIRNGIKFGMSKDEIIKIEENTIASYDYIIKNFDNNMSMEDMYNKYHTMRVVSKVLEQDFQTIQYYFDDDMKLIDVGYELNDKFTYDELLKLLKNKYGNPVNSETAKYIRGIKYTPLITTLPLYDFPGSHDINANSVYWIVEYKDCAVLIELNDGKNKESRVNGAKEVCFIGYKKTTKENIEQGIKEMKEYDKQKEEDKNNAIKTDI